MLFIVFWAPTNFLPVFGASLDIFFGNPVEWIFKKNSRRNPSEVGHSLYDVACSSAQSSSSSSAVPSGMTIRRSCSNSHQLSPSYSAIPLVPHDFFTFSIIHFAVLPLRSVILHLRIPRCRFPSTSLCKPSLTLARTRRLWLCSQTRRACGAQPIRVDPLAVWWCSALSKYYGMYGALSPTDS